MKTLFVLLFLMSCATQSRTFDYMITLTNGQTYVCDDYVGKRGDTQVYGNCEHVLFGTKVNTIHITENIKVTLVVEETK